jgi:LysM repeat protein
MSVVSMSAVNMSATAISRRSRFAATQARPMSHLRMTARGRAVLLTLVATPLVVIALYFGINAGGATATSSSAPLSTITVSQGQTLWQLARQLAPTADPRDVIADVMSVNRLTSTNVQPGQKLAIPAQYER